MRTCVSGGAEGYMDSLYAKKGRSRDSASPFFKTDELLTRNYEMASPATLLNTGVITRENGKKMYHSFFWLD